MKSLIAHISSRLSDLYGLSESEEMAWWIAEELSGQSRTSLQFGYKGTKNIPNDQTIEEIIDRLRHFEPIQYIFGHCLWAGLDLSVNRSTLIPRPETSELVERASRTAAALFPAEKGKTISALDIGTGSGCIAIALKKRHPEWSVTGVDISSDALSTARLNATRNGAEVLFERADILSDESERFRGFDLIVSNPPYIRESEKRGMRRNVLDYEPRGALFVPDSDPLVFYRRIAGLQAPLLFFEINEALGKETAEVISAAGYKDTYIYKDIYGKDRIIEGRMGQTR